MAERKRFSFTDVSGINTVCADVVGHLLPGMSSGYLSLHGIWNGTKRKVRSWQLSAGKFLLSGSVS